ncbi:hypothetical protein AMTRI_Chr07g30380 [Amborella trichopoda]
MGLESHKNTGSNPRLWLAIHSPHNEKDSKAFSFLSGTSCLEAIAEHNARVIILSCFFEYVEENGVFVLRICYGMQLIVQMLGGEVKPAKRSEYGRMNIAMEQEVWMSHGDEVIRLPEVDCLHENTIAAIENPSKKIFGLQYNPEVAHSPKGMETLQCFLFEVCKITADWELKDVLIDEIKTINNEVGPEDHVICALSGGVDLTVAATIVHEAIGDRLHCVFVDNGLLRFQEKERVMSTFQADLHPSVISKGVVEPEMKRKIIGKEFISIFDDFAHDLEKKLGRKPTLLVQGTLYPDVIESRPPPGSGRTHSHTIKSHHNVGGLPKDMKLKLIEPRLLDRDNLKFVDHIFVEAIKQAGIYDSIWHAFAVFPNIRTVGVQGDQRTHSYVVALRAITSEDGMTADRKLLLYNFDPKFLLSSKICNEVQGVNRVVYDITSKPPSTVEWE